MSVVPLSERDRVEIERSAAQASKVVVGQVEVERYLNPPPDTPYPLEYAFFLLGDVRGKTVLDFGCGSGENLIPLVERGANVIGIDISPELIQLAGERLNKAGKNAALKVASAYETGLADESVDVVFSMSLLHHLDLPTVNQEIRRILRPGGLFILKEPIRFSRTMTLVRKLFPAHDEISEFEHPLTRVELAHATKGFSVLAERSFRLPFVPVLARSIPAGKGRLWRADRWLLRHFSSLEHVASSKVMSFRR
jgi:SAM-dependent methyltransferase